MAYREQMVTHQQQLADSQASAFALQGRANEDVQVTQMCVP